MTLALIDADLIAYRCAASAENENELIALTRVNDLYNRILYEINASGHVGYLTGSNNFRYEIYPEYKANRKNKPHPKHLEACRELLVTEWKCKVTDGIEADDALGINHQAEPDSILVSIDKDLLQLPGKHYNFVKQEVYQISTLQGLRNFYTQLIEGDASDNIPAFDGKFRTSRPKFVAAMLEPLQKLTIEIDMYYHAFSCYDNKENDFRGDLVQEVMERNAQLLYIQKKEEDVWKRPTQVLESNDNTMMENGQQEDLGDLSQVCSEAEHDDGLLNTVF